MAAQNDHAKTREAVLRTVWHPAVDLVITRTTRPFRGAAEYTLPIRAAIEKAKTGLSRQVHGASATALGTVAGNSALQLFPWQTKTVTLKHESIERTLPLLLLGLALVAVPTLVWSPAGLPRLERLRQERAELHDKAARLSEEIRELQAEVARVKSDPSLLEQVARDELGLVRQTEVVFQFTP